MEESLFNSFLFAWMAVAVAIFPILLKVKAPYGRHVSTAWGPLIDNRLGWILMEMPVIIIFSTLFFIGDSQKSIPLLIMFGLFMLHYFNRIFIFPFQMKGKNKKIPLLIVLFAVVFNVLNGLFCGYWFGFLSDGYSVSWLYSWQFISGIILFALGMFINIKSDQLLIKLRSGGKSGYYIPRGWLFEYVSSPNLFGEILEWIGWALLCWCLPAFAFALWTCSNLIPRSLDHHKWYKTRFKDYPPNRKAIIPGVL